MPSRDSKWGAVHEHTRTRMMKRYRPGITICWRCGFPIDLPPRRVHLGHRDDGKGYGGLEHDTCNTSAGGVKSGMVRRGGWTKQANCVHCKTPFERKSAGQDSCPRCMKLIARGKPPVAPSGRAW